MTTTDMWTYRDTTWSGANLVGYEVEATDGDIGKIDEATYDIGSSYVVVDTGPWIFGKKVLLPAGLVGNVDVDAQKVFVNLTKDQVKNSPEFDETQYREPGYRDEVGTYYSRDYPGRDIP